MSVWAVGSRVDHVRVDGSGIADATGTLIEVDRPHRLAFSFDAPYQAGDPAFEPSLVTFEIEPYHGIVKLTLTHAHLQSVLQRDAIELGWPTVVANLKTMLETGDVLPQAPWEFHAAEREALMAQNGLPPRHSAKTATSSVRRRAGLRTER